MDKRQDEELNRDDEKQQKRKLEAEELRDMRSFWKTFGPGTRASTGGAQLDSAIDALTARVDGLEDDVAGLDTRVTALESGTEPEPPDPEPPDPEPEPDKRYPDKNDPMCGVPAGTSLTSSGSITVTQDGTVIEGKDINGQIIVNGAKNVVIRNCYIHGGDYYLIQSRNDPNFEVDHCTIEGRGASGPGQSGIDGTGHIHHCRITKCENPINVSGDGCVIEWCDIHDLDAPPAGHKDGVQVDGGIENLSITHCYIDNPDGETSAVMLDNYWGPLRNVNVEDCFLGGGGFPAYLSGTFNGSSTLSDIHYINNVMRKGGWGGYFYWDQVGSNCTKTGNVDWQTGASVDNK